MVRKKQFIDKKTAQHFHVVHRSQRDPRANDPEASKYVLLSSSQHVELRSDSESEDDEDYDSDDSDMPELLASPSASAKPPSKPQPQAKPKSKSKSAFPARRVRFGSIEAEDLVDADGLPRDGYDYTQHMKEMGQGRFYSATGRFDVASGALARKVALPEDVLPSGEEQARLLDAITLTTEAMDGDLREALENDAAFEALDDDFMAQAALEATDGDAAADDGFDYDAHIAKLMAAASGVPKVRGDLTDDEDEDDEELSDLEDEEEDDELDDEARAEEQRALDALFEKTLAEEYDDEQLGELEEDDPETRGELALEGALLDEIVADFAQVQQEVLDAEGKLGNPLAPAGNRLQQIREECAREEEEEADVEGEEAVTPAGEDVETQLRRMMERSAYLAPRAQEQWDCETIVSTYSTLDNHPTVLRETDPLKKKKKKKTPTVDAGAADGARLGRIELSRKTGMPLGVFERRRQPEEDEESEEEDDEEREDRGKARGRGESKEQKRARKAAAKLLKTQRRADKKETKLAFKDELQRQQAQTAPGRVAIFRY